MSDKMIDLSKAGRVQVEIDQTGKLWVNVDGQCRLRIGWVVDGFEFSALDGHHRMDVIRGGDSIYRRIAIVGERR